MGEVSYAIATKPVEPEHQVKMGGVLGLMKKLWPRPRKNGSLSLFGKVWKMVKVLNSGAHSGRSGVGK